MKNDYEKLKNALYSINKPSCDPSRKESIKKAVFNAMKNNLIAEESSLRKLQTAIKNLAVKVVPSPEFAAKIKERVFTFVEKHSAGPSFFWKMTWKVEKVFAGILLFVMVSGLTLMYIVDIPVTKAAKRTLIQEIAGDVKVLRGDQILDAFSGMELCEGDTIVTNEGSVAEIRYFDDSITRISDSSQIKIQKLFKDVKSSAKTQIDLELVHGRVWSQVVNLVDSDASFNVKTTEFQTTAKGKASFDIQNPKNSRKTEVAVFQNKVKVSLPKKTPDKSKMILEGYSLEVDNELPDIEKLVIKPKISEEETWVKGNIVKDREYVEKVTAEVKEAGRQEAGVLPDNPLYTAKKLNEGTRLLLVTGDENEKIKLQIDNAKTRLLEANAYFAEGKNEEGQKLLEEFKTVVSEISESIKVSEELKAYAQNQFAEESKKLAVILPDSDMYPAKEALRDAKMQLAINAEEQKAVALEHASEKMLEAKDLVKDNKNDMAVETLKNVTDDVKAGIGGTEDAADTLADAKVLTGTVEAITGENAITTRKLNRLATETEAALSTELLQAAVTEEIEAPKVEEIIPTPATAQIEVVSNTGDSDIAVIIPVEPEEQQ